MSTKSKREVMKIRRKHAKFRLQQRYDIIANSDEYNLIVRNIREHKNKNSIILRKESCTRIHCLVKHSYQNKDHFLICVYHNKFEIIVTFLPKKSYNSYYKKLSNNEQTILDTMGASSYFLGSLVVNKEGEKDEKEEVYED